MAFLLSDLVVRCVFRFPAGKVSGRHRILVIRGAARGGVGGGRPGAYRRDMRRGVVFAPLAVAALLVAACTGNSQPSTRSQPPSAVASATAWGGAGTTAAGAVTSDGCAGQPPVSPLPVWARAGFTPADMAMPHVTGAAGDIVAILWATRDALHSPPLPDRGNKILWVSRVPFAAADPLIISATLPGSTRTATASVPGGPGPSTINLPAPGCWTLHLSWSGHTDELQLRYVA
jgi:hypothetical protein